MSHADEMSRGERFAFGENWARFLELLDDRRIALAERSLRDMLGVDSLEGRTFVDAGSGSGLFSLAARRLGARVHSFDFDPSSVACTRELRSRFFRDDPMWKVEQASVLDRAYLEGLGRFDVVYSWGVLHHTGSMWAALENVTALVGPGGKLFISIYNDGKGASRRWLAVKKAYNALPGPLRWLVLIPSLVRIWGRRVLLDSLRLDPLRTWRTYAESSMRGMSAWHDVVDWVGGLPYEFASVDEIFDFYRARGFVLRRIFTVGGGLGCNEFVFHREV